ncbi:MAG: glycosyltransferase family 4 protein [Aquificae bacterium]|nr:glycosyltransferase family 4 protein [Aquificota bacterium]
MKVLEVIEGLGWCGTKEQTYLITKHLSKYFNVEIALAFNHKEMINRLKDKVPLKFYEEDNGNSKRRFKVKNYKRLYYILKNGNYDVVVANSSWSLNYILAVYPFLRKKPKLIAMRRSGFTPSFFSKNFKYRFADKIVVVSKQVAQELKEKNFFPEKLVTIESGIDLSRFKPSSEFREKIRKELGIKNNEFLFINVANFQPWRKGQDILLKAFKELSCEKCKLVLVGIDTDSLEARKLIKNLGLEKKVIALGFRNDVEKLLQGADFFVLSSNSEGIAGALLQAMATGKIVLSTLVGGIGEYLKDGINGFSAPVGDYKRLAEKMKLLTMLTEEEKEKLRKNAIKTTENYSITITSEKWKYLIESVIKGNS